MPGIHESGIIDDPNADARSLMMRAKCVCNGEANGVQCKHYWGVNQKFRSINSDSVRRGEQNRSCKHVDGFLLEFVSEEKPTYCNHYEPRGAPGLVALVARAVSLALGLGPKSGIISGWIEGSEYDAKQVLSTMGFIAYDGNFEGYKPLTNEEISRLREEMPDRPVVGRWKTENPGTLGVDDIVNGPQIGMLKPGEPIPGLELSKETEAALGGIFDGKTADRFKSETNGSQTSRPRSRSSKARRSSRRSRTRATSSSVSRRCSTR